MWQKWGNATTKIEDLHTVEGPDELIHGTSVLNYLVLPQAQNSRGVCAYSYFASVTTAHALMSLGLSFIGVVELATPKFAIQYIFPRAIRERRTEGSSDHEITC